MFTYLLFLLSYTPAEDDLNYPGKVKLIFLNNSFTLFRTAFQNEIGVVPAD